MELEKQVSALTESLDMAESYSRHLNTRAVGLAEDTETGQPAEFFESWLPRVLKLTIKASCRKLREPTALLNRNRTQTGAPGRCCYDSTHSETNRGLWMQHARPARMVT